ncbi:LytTR family DNA-binding domain-containing protein [Murimonas intestini]|uniref:LytTR family DNA-binding domain-containing protein n=1 Tax=Murimonas intestini TaxID=1337051 RepID=UPI00165250A9|nr:LytTR family DNA-binding domain-containing protein [Murimonas intestini]
MKVFVKENEKIREMEVVIRCSRMEPGINKLVNHIRQFSIQLPVWKDGEQYQIPLYQVYYLETVDGKTYVYTASDIYSSRETTAALEKQLEGSSIIRISRSCLLNLSCLKCVAPLGNHRLMATLKNGEKLIVGRTYIEPLKQRLK